MRKLLSILLLLVASLLPILGQEGKLEAGTTARTGKELLAELDAFLEKYRSDKELHYLDHNKLRSSFVA
ncbi:hypothetical protein N9Z83_01655 [Akkermansiaceae bacterium]|nr:hypothetical protein [Akkermansiaceae bacterium]